MSTRAFVSCVACNCIVLHKLLFSSSCSLIERPSPILSLAIIDKKLLVIGFAFVRQMGEPLIFLAVDIGGTFTDLIAFDDASSRFFQAKSLTTPRDPVEGIIDCIRKSGIE